MYIAVEIATVIIETIIISIYLKGLFQTYTKSLPTILLSYGIFAAVLCVASLLPVDPIIRLGYGCVSFFILAKLLFDQKWYTALFSAILLTAIVGVIDIVAYGIMNLFNIPAEVLMAYGNERIIFIVMGKLVELFCVFLVIKLSQWRRANESLINAVPLLLCQVFSILICYVMYLGSLETAMDITAPFIAAAIGILFINIVIFVFVERIKEVSEIKKQNALAEQHYKSKLEYFEQVRDDQEMTRALWHDIRKYLNTMNELMNRNDIDHARECIGQVSELFEDIGKVVDVGNTVISAVLNHSVQKAHRTNIDVDLDVRVKPDLNVSAADLSIIIGNTFDNAIEAAAISAVENKKIKVTLIEKDTLLLYEITNSYDPNAPEQKKDRKQHGFGLKNVKRCVDKYKGSMNLEKRGGEFMVTIHLNIPAEITGTLLAS